MIRFRFSPHSEEMSLAHARTHVRQGSLVPQGSMNEGVGRPLQPVAERAASEQVTGEHPSYGDVVGAGADVSGGDRISGCTPKRKPPSSSPVAVSPTESGPVPVASVGAVDWSAEAVASRIRQLVSEHVDFVWRSLRALGVPAGDCDDGCQKVWWVVARKIASIEVGKERSYIFSVVMRVASDMRRSALSQRKASLGDATSLDHDLVSAEPSAEELYDRQRARAVLEQMLGNMPWEQRVVFVMFEVEELGLQEIAEALGVPRGTVASRLRLAREAFNRALARHQERSKHPGGWPMPPDPRGRPRPPMHSQQRELSSRAAAARDDESRSALFASEPGTGRRRTR